MIISQKDSIHLSLQAADDKKAEDPVALDVHGISSVTDFFIIASGNSDTQVRAIADGIVETLSGNGVEPIGTEGYNEGSWILLDYADFVVHIFHRDKRAYYALESLWGDAPRLRIEDIEGSKDAGKK